MPKSGKAAAWASAGVAAGMGLAVYRRTSAAAANRAFLLGGPAGRRGQALVTGASAGIGQAYARQLAALGYDLLLVARRQERLTALAVELHRNCDVTVDTLAADLADAGGVSALIERLPSLDRLDILVNNAGFGTTGHFARSDMARQLDMINLHVVASARLVRAALPGMLERGRGAIVNVASVAAWIPLLGNVSYTSSKRYLVSFSQALDMEVVGKGVYVQALCPGFTRSEFHDQLIGRGFERSLIPSFMWMDADAVARGSIAALGTGKVVVIPGVLNQLLVLAAGSGLLTPLMRLAAGRLRPQG